MSAIPSAILPIATTLPMAPCLDLVPGGELGFEAQYSALLGALGPAGETTTPTGAAVPVTAGLALRQVRTGKDAGADGKVGGKTGGNADGKSLPEGLAGYAVEEAGDTEARQGIDAEAGSLPANISPGDGAVTPAQTLLALAMLPAQAAMPPRQEPVIAAATESGALPDATATSPHKSPHAAASTAPVAATATSVPLNSAQSGEHAALPTATAVPEAAAQTVGTRELPSLPANPAPLDPARPAGAALTIAGSVLRRFAPEREQAPSGVTAPPAQSVATATSGGTQSPQMPATLQLLGDGAAGVLAGAAAQRGQKSAEPSPQVAIEPVSTERAAAAPDSLAAPPTLASSIAATGIPAPVPGAAPQPHDFAALIDRLVEARHAVQSTLTSQTVQASVQHAEFGRVSLSFQQDAAGMTVTFANPDPELARAVQNISLPAAAANTGGNLTGDNGANSTRQDWQGSGASGSGQASGQSQGQSHSQSSAPQQRATPSTPGRRGNAPDDASSPPSAPRSGIFA